MSDQDYQKLHTEVGEAIRAGEAVDLDRIRLSIHLGFKGSGSPTDVAIGLLHELIAEVERLRAASDAPERADKRSEQ